MHLKQDSKVPTVLQSKPKIASKRKLENPETCVPKKMMNQCLSGYSTPTRSQGKGKDPPLIKRKTRNKDMSDSTPDGSPSFGFLAESQTDSHSWFGPTVILNFPYVEFFNNIANCIFGTPLVGSIPSNSPFNDERRKCDGQDNEASQSLIEELNATAVENVEDVPDPDYHRKITFMEQLFNNTFDKDVELFELSAAILDLAEKIA